MLGVLLDLVIVIAMQSMLEGAADDWRELIMPVLAITFGNLAIAFGLGAFLGLLVVVPMAILTVAALVLLCHMALRNALITAAVLIAVKIGLTLLLA